MQRASELHLLVHFLDFLNSWGWARSSNPCGWQGPRCFPKEPAQAQPPDVPCRPPEGCVPLLWGQAPAPDHCGFLCSPWSLGYTQPAESHRTLHPEMMNRPRLPSEGKNSLTLKPLVQNKSKAGKVRLGISLQPWGHGLRAQQP